jgi:hypothetical protein
MRCCLGTASRFVAAASAGCVWTRDVLTVVSYSNRILCSPQLRSLPGQSRANERRELSRGRRSIIAGEIIETAGCPSQIDAERRMELQHVKRGTQEVGKVMPICSSDRTISAELRFVHPSVRQVRSFMLI